MYTAEIPYGVYWSTPFAKWQGSLQHLNAIEFAAHVAKQELARRNFPLEEIDHAILGTTVPQHHSFYGTPWMTGMMGLMNVTGPTIAQACATGARTVQAAAQEILTGDARTVLVVTADRCSNGPHLYYPAPKGPGGTGAHEDWVLDNFSCDPLGLHAMLDTAENVAKKHGISTDAQHDLVLRRAEQYRDALKDDQAFQKRYMTLPFPVPAPNFKKDVAALDGDEGIFPTSAESMAKLQPVKKGGTVTFAAQTHPADGNAGLIITTPERAQALSKDAKIAVRIRGFGQARTTLAHMPEATIPAARRALAQAGKSIADMAAIKSHNPFAVNDIVFAKETGADLRTMNNYGSSLIWGHPQGPTGLRSLIELIEELALRGGGFGLFQGCAAGDSAMAVVIEVTGR
jgi:acetyl-CoA acetyltransferase